MFKKIALAATTAVAFAAPAKADTNDLLKGIVGVIILKEIITSVDSVTVSTPHTHRNTPQRGEVCYTEVDETQNWITIHQMDCYGARVSSSRHRKY